MVAGREREGGENVGLTLEDLLTGKARSGHPDDGPDLNFKTDG